MGNGKPSPAAIVVAGLAILAAVCWVDYITAYDLHFQIFYFLPVSLCGWYLNRRMVVIMAVICGIAWGFVDNLSGHPYENRFYWYWNIFACLASLLVLGLILQQLRFNLAEQNRAQEELRQAFEQLKQSSAEIQKLRSHLQVFCAWTKRIQVEGKWMTVEDFLTNHLRISITHGIAPEIMEEIKKEFDDGLPPGPQ